MVKQVAFYFTTCSLNLLILVVSPVLSDKGIGLCLSEVLRFVFRGILFTINEYGSLFLFLNINAIMFAFEKSPHYYLSSIFLCVLKKKDVLWD